MKFKITCHSYRNLLLLSSILLLIQPFVALGQSSDSVDAPTGRVEDAQQRLAAIKELSQPGHEKDATKILTLLKRETDPAVRAQAINALGMSGLDSKEVIEQYILALESKNEKVLASAAFTIGMIAKPNTQNAQLRGAIQPLIKALSRDRSIELRRNAALALGQIGIETKEATLALTEALKDKEGDGELRQRAATALGLIRANADEAVTQLIDTLNNTQEDHIIRDSAAQSLGQIGLPAKRALPILARALGEPLISENAAESIVAISNALADSKDTEAIEILRSSRDDLPHISTPDVETAKVAINNSLTILTQLKRHWIRKQAEAHPYLSRIVVSYAVLLLAIVILLWLRPLWLLYANEALVPVTELPLPLPKPFDTIKLPFRHFLLLGFFHYHPCVLDAWVCRHLPDARDFFARKSTVSERAVYVPVPVVSGKQILPSPTAVDLQPLLERNIVQILISGEGGAGKTSLACELGRWSMAEDVQQRLCKTHRMLPILIEHDLVAQDEKDKNLLLQTIQKQLRILIAEVDAVPLDFVRHLLKRRRLLLIVDSLSEMSAASRLSIISSIAEIPVNAVIFTSRTDEDLGEMQPHTLTPMRIKGNNLSRFMNAYLEHKGKRHLFNDAEFFDACRKLSLVVGERDVTALLAKSFAEQLIANKEGIATNLPENIPDLMLNYLRVLNRRPVANFTDSKIIIIAAKAQAWACLKRNLRPMPISYKASLAALRRAEVTEELRGIGFPDTFSDVARRQFLINYLDSNLKIIKTSENGRDSISFTLDPLSEYLASLRLIRKYRDNHKAWHQFLQKVVSQKGGAGAIKGFLLALRDCCQSSGVEFRVPDFVAAEVENLLMATPNN
jgi:HEAT repeat protein